MIELLDLNDNSKDVEIGTDNVGRVYGGRGGKKVAGKIGNDYYLIKMPNNLSTRIDRPNENIEIPYNNSPISEYIGSHVYDIIGIRVHKTYLGKRNGKIAVACKDFRKDGEILQHFCDIKVTFNHNNEQDENTNGNGSHLSSILNVIRNSNVFKNIDIDAECFFWQMFVVDYLIGNIDRNNGNWGILNNEINGTKVMAPVFDNGNCLNNLISDRQIEKIIHENKFDVNLDKQMSFFVDDNEKPINMYEYIINQKEKKLNDTIIDIVPRINLNKINEMIEDIPLDIVSKIRRKYYETIISKRYNDCLLPVYNSLCS